MQFYLDFLRGFFLQKISLSFKNFFDFGNFLGSDSTYHLDERAKPVQGRIQNFEKGGTNLLPNSCHYLAF